MKNEKEFNAALNHAIRTASAQCGKGREFSRSSILTRENIMRLLIGAEGGSLDKILHTAGIEVTASAVSQRRAQIDPGVFHTVFRTFNGECGDSDFFRGYRLLAVDGTTINLPRDPKAPSFVCNAGIPKGVNQLHVTPLYDLLSHTFADAVIRPEPQRDEIGALIKMLQQNDFPQKTLIIADRGTKVTT
jgi:hypothetical protein